MKHKIINDIIEYFEEKQYVFVIQKSGDFPCLFTCNLNKSIDYYNSIEEDHLDYEFLAMNINTPQGHIISHYCKSEISLDKLNRKHVKTYNISSIIIDHMFKKYDWFYITSTKFGYIESVCTDIKTVRQILDSREK